MAILEERDEEMDEICSSTAAQGPESIVIPSNEEARPPLQPQLPPSRTVRWTVSIRYEDSSLGTKTFDYVNPFTVAMMDDAVAGRVQKELLKAILNLLRAENRQKAQEIGQTRS